MFNFAKPVFCYRVAEKRGEILLSVVDLFVRTTILEDKGLKDLLYFYRACHIFRYFCLLLIFEILLDEIDYARRTSTFTFTYYFYLLGLNVSLNGIKGCIFSNNCNVYIFFYIRKLFSFHPFPPILKNLRYDITLRKH